MIFIPCPLSLLFISVVMDTTQLITILSICIGGPILGLLLYCLLRRHDRQYIENVQRLVENNNDHSIIDPFNTHENV